MTLSTHARCAAGLGAALALFPSTAAPVRAAAPALASAAPLHLVRRIPLPGAEGWDYLALDPVSRRLYISRGTREVVLNVDTGKVVGEIAGTAGVHGVALDPETGRGFTSNGRSNTVTIFDTKTLRKIGDVPVGEGTDAIVFEPVTRRVFTFNGQAQTATAIDAASGKVVGTVTLPGRPEYPVADGKGNLYNNIEDKSEIARIDARTLEVTAVWPIAPGEGPSGLAMDTKSRRLFSVCDHTMVVLDADTGKVVAAPPIGAGPDACAFDPATHLVFSPNGEDGTLTVIRETDPNQYKVVGTLSTQPGARTMALDTKTHHVFTCTATALPAAPGQPRWRRSYADGSFVVLEYAP